MACEAPLLPAPRVSVRRLIECAMLLFAIFALAALASGCRFPEERYIAADQDTYDLFAPMIREHLAHELVTGALDNETAWLYGLKLESWRDRIDEARHGRGEKVTPPKPGTGSP